MFGTRTFGSLSHVQQFHDDRLIVKLYPAGAVSGIRARAMQAESSFMASNPGMGMLERMDRAGMIDRVTSLDAMELQSPNRIASSSAFVRMMSMASATSGTASNSASTGMRMVRMSAGADLGQLQGALMEDPSVEMVSRVPIRYLLAKKKTAAKAARTKGSSRTSNTKKGIGISAIPPSPTMMWNLQKIKWDAARLAGLNQASSVRVSVLDTGVDLGHPDLPGSLIDYTYDYGDADARASDLDIVGHGTHVSGTIRALANGNAGINGICDCKLAVYKIFNDAPEFTGMEQGWESHDYLVDPEMYHSALARCAVDGTRVVTLSIGGNGLPSQAERLLVKDLIDRNICVVAAMGNDDSFVTSYPAGISGVIAVGASRINDVRATFSNKGIHIALLAPGEDIWSTLPTNTGDMGYWRNPITGQTVKKERELDYDAWPGTSMAAPHVVAAVALILGKDSSLTASDVRNILIKNADKLFGMNGANFDSLHGFGRLNLERIANAI